MPGLIHRRSILLALILVLLIVVAAPILAYPMGRDQGIYSAVANTILDGKIPYVTMWEQKPPPIFYLYALFIGIFGQTTWAIRMIDLATVPLTCLALYWLGDRLANRRVGLLVIVVFGVFYFTESFASLSQSDAVVTLPMTLAVLAAFVTAGAGKNTRRALRGALVTGALCAVVVWFKHFYVFFALALVLNHLLARRGFVLKEAAAFCAGGLVVGLPLLAYFYVTGILEQLIINAQAGVLYTGIGGDFATLADTMWHYFTFRWWQWGVMLMLAALWLPLRWLGGARQAGWRLVLLWLLGGLAFLLVQAKGFDTHWVPMLPPLALLAADALDQLLSALAPRLRLPYALRLAAYGLAVTGLLFILGRMTWGRAWPFISGQETGTDFYDQFQANDVKPVESLAMAAWLQQQGLERGAYLYIWGFRPEVYYLGGWKPASRFPSQAPLVGDFYPAAWKDENVQMLEQNQPRFILVLQADYMPWVTGSHEDSHQLLVEYAQLSNWIGLNYDRQWDSQIGNFLIWRRKT